MTEKELLADCLRRLNRANVPYMLTGSMAVQAGSLNIVYLKKWATILGVTDSLKDLLTGKTKPKQT